MTTDTTQTPARQLPAGLLSGLSEAIPERSADRNPVNYHHNNGRHDFLESSRGNSMPTPTELELILKAQSRDGEAFEELLRRCGDPSLRLIRTKIFSEIDREDVQQIWREIAWRNIGKFKTASYSRYTPFLTGAAVLAIQQFLTALGNAAGGIAVLKAAMKNPAVAFFPGGQPIKPPADQIIGSAQEHKQLIHGILTAGLPAYKLLAFLLIRVLDENPAAGAGDPDRTAVRKIVEKYWNVHFGRLKEIFLDAYSADSGIPLSDLRALFSELDKILVGVEDECFADHCEHHTTKERRVTLSRWVNNAHNTIVDHLKIDPEMST